MPLAARRCHVRPGRCAVGQADLLLRSQQQEADYEQDQQGDENDRPVGADEVHFVLLEMTAAATRQEIGEKQSSGIGRKRQNQDFEQKRHYRDSSAGSEDGSHETSETPGTSSMIRTSSRR